MLLKYLKESNLQRKLLLFWTNQTKINLTLRYDYTIDKWFTARQEFQAEKIERARSCTKFKPWNRKFYVKV